MAGKSDRLTLFEASALVAGIGVGGGIMAVPYLASLNGLLTLFAVLAAAYFLSLVLHLMIAETVMRDGSRSQLVELFDRYVFRGPAGNALTWLFFVLLTLGFICNLAGYIAGGGEIIAALTGMPVWAGDIATYAVAAGVVFFGLKAIGVSEKIAISGIFVLLVVMSAGSAGKEYNQLPLYGGAPKTALALYGMIMFSFACFWSIPQAVEGLQWNPRLVPWAVAIGIAINMALVLILSVMSMLVSQEVTDVAIVGWGRAIGKWALALGSGFGLLAILTSYWSVTYAFVVIMEERLGLGYRMSWFIATTPTILLAVTGVTGFLGFMRITGGAIAVMLALLVVPAFRMCRREHPDRRPEYETGALGALPFQALVIAAYILMAAGSMIPLD